MKKLFSLLLAVTMLALACGCAKENDPPASTGSDQNVNKDGPGTINVSTPTESTDNSDSTEPESNSGTSESGTSQGGDENIDFYSFMSLTYGEMESKHELEFVSLQHGGSPYYRVKDLGEVYVMFDAATDSDKPSSDSLPTSVRVADAKYKVAPGISCGVTYNDIKQAVPKWDDVGFSSEGFFTTYETNFTYEKHLVSVWWTLTDDAIKKYEEQMAVNEKNGTYDGDVALYTFSEFIKSFIDEPNGTVGAIEIFN